MKVFLIYALIVGGSYLALAETNSSSDCACNSVHDQKKDLLNITGAIDLASQQDQNDFYKKLNTAYENLINSNNELAKAVASKTATNKDKLETNVEESEDKLFDLLDKNRLVKRQLNDPTIKLILDSIYLGNSTNTNDIYGDILLDFYAINPHGFDAKIELLKQENPPIKFEELTSIKKASKEEQKTGSNDPND